MLRLGGTWDKVLEKELKSEYFNELLTFLEIEYKFNNVFPPREDIFNAFRACDYDNVKVVILGQDPYHEPGQAHGLAFSVRDGVKLPPSLKNIYKEMEAEFGVNPGTNGDLTYLANQGVLLLNTVLTVRAHEAFSHRRKGWERFTDAVITGVGKKKEPVVFILWGKPAGEKEGLITGTNHLILKAAHPSPLSARRGFFGCDHFKKCNDYLISNNMSGINWVL